MKKLLTILLLCAVCICCAIGFAACDSSSADTRDVQILSVYNTYVAYAEESGETPLSYEEWLASIKGEKGDKGDKGEKGDTGAQGERGEKGVDGKDGTDGLDGKDGKDGINGIDGKDGTNGVDGKDGVGIKSAAINENGDLIIILTDDTPINAGKVIAPAEKLDDKNKITFKSFNVDDKIVSGKVSNETNTFYFTDEIAITGHAGYKVFRDFDCQQEVVSKTVNLSVGDNYFYILEYCGEYSNFYTVNVRRKPIYKVTFDSNGGSECAAQQVEEDAFAVDPKPVLNGYGYTWDYDLSTPITGNKTITASWQAIFTIERYAEGDRIMGLTAYGKTLAQITIPDEVDGRKIRDIHDGAFSWERNLSSVILYENIIEGSIMFSNCNLNVFYTGTTIDIEKCNSIRKNSKFVTLFCYSGTEPQESGNFWHYDTDGTTPVIWE